MKQDKIHLVNKIFNNETFRIVWNKLKQRLKDKGNETVTNCHQLKLKVQERKYHLTDVVDIEGMLINIIQSEKGDII